MIILKSINLQESISPIIEQLTFFHDHSLIIIIIITTIIFYIIITIYNNKIINKFLFESQNIEIIWTIIPGIILIFIALPSLRLLYLIEEINNPSITIKTIGHQWYWSYEYSNFNNIQFDSFIIPRNELNNSEFRLLEVNNRTIIPFKTQIRILVSSADVIHSWTVPRLGVKTDANPGRLNQIYFFIKQPKILFGQCSEICGSIHSFIPIVLESISKNDFIKWLKNFYLFNIISIISFQLISL